MSHIDDLIQRMCPTGVEFKALGEIGQLVRGNGMPKSDFVPSGVGCIHYGQIYTFYGTWASETISFIAPEKAKKLAKVDPGDLIITNTSESLEDVCKAVAWLGDEQIVTGGHATVLKHRQNPKYLAYCVQSSAFQDQKRRLATGTKVIDVSAKSLAKVVVPVPSLEVQEEIVRILDSLQSLEADLKADLEAELEARQRQYWLYRQALLNFDHPSENERVALRDIAYFVNGKAHERLVDPGGDIALMTSRFISTQGRAATRFVHRAEVLTPAFKDQLALVMSDLPNGRALARAFYVNEDDRYAANQRVCLLQVVDPQVVSSRFLYYIVDRNPQLLAYDSGVDQTHLKKDQILDMRIPVPALTEQDRIVSILDKFDSLVNDLSVGLRAELAARRRQYEYYRDRLLTFEEAS